MNFSIALIALMIASPSLAQDPLLSRPSIIVRGEGTAEATADVFRISAEIEGRGPTQVEAIRAMNSVQAGVEEGLRNLEGIERARLTTSGGVIAPTHAPDCGGDYRDNDNCPVTGYSATVQLNMEAGPVDRAGAALSLASELGANTVEFEGSALAEPSNLEALAKRAAFADAQRQAQALADASGRRVVRILRIQEGDRVTGLEDPFEGLETIVVSGSRRRLPSAPINLTPPPVTATARVSVMFEIE